MFCLSLSGTYGLFFEENLAPNVGVKHGLNRGCVVACELCIVSERRQKPLGDPYLLFDVENCDVRRDG